jgi:membrane-bound lytic murein transglycosylase A
MRRCCVSLKLFCLFIAFIFVIPGCAVRIQKPAEVPIEKAPERPPEKPLPPLVLIAPEDVPALNDDLQGESLDCAIEKSMRYYDAVAEKATYSLGDDKYSARELKESLAALREIISGPEPDDVKKKRIVEMFDLYKATGSDGKGTVLFTGYFEPIMEGSLEKTSEYRYPIYRTPDDAIQVNLGKFGTKYKNDKIVGRLKHNELVPYFTRGDIDIAGSLRSKQFELLWVKDAIDLFFMHIQGSGKIVLPDGRFIQVSYAQSNGRPYRSVGRYLLDHGKLSANEITHETIKKYLKEHPDELSDILNYNESYVFFRIVNEGPVGALGLTLTAARSVATDIDLFPKGAIAFIRLKKPAYDDGGKIIAWESFSRFVLNQDTGGVIKGPGRVDLFCGTGTDAERLAGSLKEKGELYFLVKKKGDKN